MRPSPPRRFLLHRVRLVALLCSVWALAVVEEGRACDVPVFRYALQYWEPDSYVVEISGFDATLEEQRLALERLRSCTRGRPAINIDVRVVSRSDGEDAAVAAEMRLCAPVHTPDGSGSERTVLWRAPLNALNVERLIDSPLRREVVRRIKAGETVVWILVECGDEARDARAAADLREQLAHLEATLELPPRATEGLLGADPVTPPLRIAFSMLRLSRDEPAETPFAAALLGGEAARREAEEPAAIPLFGRARMLEPLHGEAIEAHRLRTACEFLVGPCACEAKQRNPGLDLPVLADWEEGISGNLIEVIDLDQLTGLGTLAEAIDTPEPPDPAPLADTGVARGGEEGSLLGSTAAAGPGATPSPGDAAGDSRRKPAAPITILVAMLAAIGLVVGAATVWIMRRKP